MQDVVETAHIFFKLMEKFCDGTVVVQKRKILRAKNKTKRNTQGRYGNSVEMKNVWNLKQFVYRNFYQDVIQSTTANIYYISPTLANPSKSMRSAET